MVENAVLIDKDLNFVKFVFLRGVYEFLGINCEISFSARRDVTSFLNRYL